MALENSILKSTKKILGLSADDESFDHDVIVQINSVFVTLNQLGLGPPAGFMIEGDSEDWSSYLGDDLLLNSVRTYMYLRVRMAFDPPATSFHINAIQEQIKELEVRLNIYRESYAWVNPLPELDVDDEFIIEGGSP